MSISPSSAGILPHDVEVGGTTTEKADFVPVVLLPVVAPTVDWCDVKRTCEFDNDKGAGLVFGCWLFKDTGGTAMFIIFFLVGESGLLGVDIAETT